MERLDNDEAQWIVLMGFMVAVAFFFLALVINQSTLVGQTTAEGVLEFPKEEIRDFTAEVSGLIESGDAYNGTLNRYHQKINESLKNDIITLEEVRNNAIVDYSVTMAGKNNATFHFNNGVTEYDATVGF